MTANHVPRAADHQHRQGREPETGAAQQIQPPADQDRKARKQRQRQRLSVGHDRQHGQDTEHDGLAPPGLVQELPISQRRHRQEDRKPGGREYHRPGRLKQVEARRPAPQGHLGVVQIVVFGEPQRTARQTGRHVVADHQTGDVMRCLVRISDELSLERSGGPGKPGCDAGRNHHHHHNGGKSDSPGGLAAARVLSLNFFHHNAPGE